MSTKILRTNVRGRIDSTDTKNKVAEICLDYHYNNKNEETLLCKLLNDEIHIYTDEISFNNIFDDIKLFSSEDININKINNTLEEIFNNLSMGMIVSFDLIETSDKKYIAHNIKSSDFLHRYIINNRFDKLKDNRLNDYRSGPKNYNSNYFDEQIENNNLEIDIQPYSNNSFVEQFSEV
jgi:hypothetical protein